jgi:Outer membrane protein beta-barrel domain
MFNLSDKDLDRLSREAAEKYEVDKNPGAWNKLEQLLDKELGRSSPVPKLIRPGNPFIYFPALVILIGATYFLLKPSKHTLNSTQKNYSSVNKKAADSIEKQAVITSANNNSINDKPSASNNESVKDNSINKNKPVNKADETTEIKKINTSPDKNIIKEKSQNINPSLSANNKRENTASFEKNNKPSVNNNGFNKPNTNGDDYAENNNGSPADRNPVNKNHSAKNDLHHSNKLNKEEKDINNIENKGYTVNNTQQNQTDKSSALSEENLKFAAIPGIQVLIINNNYTVHDSILKDLTAQETGLTNLNKNNHNKKLYTNRSLQIGFLLSPDFSEVKYNYANKVGSNIGFTVGYQLSNKFSVNSGLIFTKKNYTVNGRDFHAPPGYWTNTVNLEFVKGNCNMLEIPLNLRYDFNKAGNTTFFVSSGLSSYLMKKENYSFYFHSNNIGFSQLARDSYKTNHDYWLSVFNLSMGFETKISNSFSFQVEPYMKLPLTGIGFGKVDLSSYGINFSIKFAPLLSRSRH